MKKIQYTLILLLLTVIYTSAQDSIYVYKNGAVNSKFPLTLVDSLTFSSTLDTLKMSNNGTVTTKLPFAAFDSISFQPPLPKGTYRDIDGNVYTTVKIGTQTWMIENLKTTRYRNGEPIPNITSSSEWTALTTGGYSAYENNSANGKKYGYLYNWYAVNDYRNIAPAGWRVPSIEDWATLENYLITNQYNYDNTTTGNKIAKSLASKTDWKGSGGAGAPGNRPEWNNTSGFTALPGGGRYGTTGTFFSQTEAGFWWVKEETTQVEANYRGLFYGYNFFQTFVNSKKLGLSLRLIKTEVPTLTTSIAKTITLNSAISGGNVTADSKDEITVKGVCWNTTGNPTIINDKTNNGTGMGSFDSQLSNLKPGTTYYVRAYATNSAGTGYGNEISFTTLATLPTLTTDQATAISGTSATSGGKISTDGGSAITAKGICWSTNQNPTTADSKTIDGAGKTSFTSQLTGLTKGTTYYARAYATNSIGTAYGAQITFTTLDIATITTSSITVLTDSSAVAGGVIVSNGGSTITTKGICWSVNATPTINDNVVLNTSNNTTFTSEIKELDPATVYNVRAFATNSVGTAYGDVVSFKTLASEPFVATVEISAIDSSTAVSGGVSLKDGGSAITAKGICWSLSENPTIADSITVDGIGTASYVSTMRYLKPGTIYYVRAYATNTIGTYYGAQLSFKTLDLAKISTTAASDLTKNSVKSGGEITNDGGSSIIAKGVCWSTTPSPTIAETTNKTNDGTGTGVFNSSITGLTPGTTYYIRAYATNSVGTSYGTEISITTLTDENP